MATTTTMKSTTDTANANFITDPGSIRLRFSRARRVPREADELTDVRAARTASPTRAAPTADALPIPGGRPPPLAGRPAVADVRAASGCGWVIPGVIRGWVPVDPVDAA
ncbi:hypothetical protein ONO86_03009 [Micromonospora noduli]|nr:hypothetical protein ONO86_03009 [Micromonospora noduli]